MNVETEESSHSHSIYDESSPKIRSRVKDLAKSLVLRPLSMAYNTIPMPQAISSVLKDASLTAVEEVEIVMEKNNNVTQGSEQQALDESKKMIMGIIDEAFAPVESSLAEMEASLENARKALETAKLESYQAVEAIQVAAIAQAEGAATAVAQAEKFAESQVLEQIYSSAMADIDISDLSFDDVDYESSEMAPPFLDPNSCLVPGEPVVRVERAPENSRRIFAGIDITASVDDVWNVLTNYSELQNVIPNLVMNEVLDLYEGGAAQVATFDNSASEEDQCKQVAENMKGALLKQVGGAKVAGINFSAKTTLEVREWPQGLPDFAHYTDEMWKGKSRDDRAKEYPKVCNEAKKKPMIQVHLAHLLYSNLICLQVKLKRYRFPRPFALSSLPTREISMQSIPDDDGEFRLYQGVWKMQPLPGCAQPGEDAMRLTYAVEISPRAYLPVGLIERRIVKDLCTNLEAIRNAVTKD